MSVCFSYSGKIMRWFFVLSGLMWFTGKAVSSSCPIDMSPSRVVVKHGDPFTVTCNSPAANIDSMGWEAIYGEGIGSTDNVSSVVLKVNSAKDWDMRTICFVNFLDGSQCTAALPVTVYQLDTVFMSTSQEGPMVEGTKYRMQCDVGGVAPARNLVVLWYKGDEIIYTETFTESSLSPVSKSSVLKLIAKRGDNGSLIRCEAKLDFNPPVPNLPTILSMSHEVVVLYSPVFTNPENETLELSSGSKLRLDCSAAGNPAPTFSWGFPHQIQQSTKINGNESILTPSIQLPGSYNCTASNTQGTRTKHFTVTEAQRDRTVLAAVVGVVGLLGVAGLLAGLFFVKSDGTFPCNKGSYLKGQPTSSGPV